MNNQKQPHKFSNGRVDILGEKMNDLFQMYDKIPAKQMTTFRDPLQGIWDNTSLSNIFFSNKNVDIIQNGMRAGVYEKSNGQYVISNQDEDTLRIIMRSVFLQNATNQPDNIIEQVKELNKIVWNITIPQLYGEAQGYYKYLSDASTMYTPLALPVFAENNDKQLVLKNWF
jgi:hypothetical protein